MKTPYFTTLEPPTGLYEKVVSRIEAKDKKRKNRRLFFSAGFVLLGLVSFVPAVIWFIRDLYLSGFAQTFSLIFSDGSTIVAYWQSLALSLLESLPFASLMTCLVALFVVVLSARLFFVSKRNHGHSLKLT